MGHSAGRSYSLGVQMGLGWYFASKGATELAQQAREHARDQAWPLAASLLRVVEGVHAANLESWQRGRSHLRELLPGDRPMTLDRVYWFGVLMGLAEGQASLYDAAAHAHARVALDKAEAERAYLQRAYGQIDPLTSDVDHALIRLASEKYVPFFFTNQMG